MKKKTGGEESRDTVPLICAPLPPLRRQLWGSGILGNNPPWN
jgi:hypothetical protein